MALPIWAQLVAQINAARTSVRMRGKIPRFARNDNRPYVPAMPTRPPSSRYAWYVVAVLCLANVSGWVDRGILGILVPSIEQDFKITDTQASLLQGLAFGL